MKNSLQVMFRRQLFQYGGPSSPREVGEFNMFFRPSSQMHVQSFKILLHFSRYLHHLREERRSGNQGIDGTIILEMILGM
jgi:hypothetical protein